MKLGIAYNFPHTSPEEWAEKYTALGLSAVVFPCGAEADTKVIDGYTRAAQSAGLCIAEVGAWCNPMDPDPAVRAANRRKCIRQLELAEYVGANCCVNICGAVGSVWDGSYAENYSAQTYADVVECVREIVDAVRPVRTHYTLEPMPHMLPDSPEVYAQLLRDIDRTGFGAHLDLVNLLVSPREFYNNRGLIDRCFAQIGPQIRSCHLKDAILDHSLTVSIREAACGKGGVDLGYYMKKADECSPELPMIIEHLPEEGAYLDAVNSVMAIYRGVK